MIEALRWLLEKVGGNIVDQWFKRDKKPHESRILDHRERPFAATPFKWRALLTWCVVVLIVVALGWGGSHYYVSHHPKRPGAPTLIRVAAVYDIPIVTSKGRTVNLPGELYPCSNGKTGVGIDYLDTLPGGQNLTKPYLLLKTERFVFAHPGNAETDEVLIETELTNRGETSIAKDWDLCFMSEDHKAIHIPALKNVRMTDYPETGDSAISLSDSTASAPIQHGRFVDGWLVFHLPKDVPLASLKGTVSCHDYLERKSRIVFKFAPSSVASSSSTLR